MNSLPVLDIKNVQKGELKSKSSRGKTSEKVKEIRRIN